MHCRKSAKVRSATTRTQAKVNGIESCKAEPMADKNEGLSVYCRGPRRRRSPVKLILLPVRRRRGSTSTRSLAC